MKFGVLGTIEARRDGHTVPLGGPKQRALLAFLLLRANQAVSRDRLIDALWGDRPPARADASLDSYVSRLRKLLGAERVVRESSGYLLKLERDELDLDRFERLVSDGRFGGRSSFGAGQRSPTSSSSRSRTPQRRNSRSGGCSRSSSGSTLSSSPARG